MNKKILSALVLISGILVSGAIIGSAKAQTTQSQPALQPQEQKMPGDIKYPIPELGNCKSKSDCRVFCDDSKNLDACLAFAKERNLMSSEELANAKKFQDNGMTGPGGCKGQAACDQYCGNSTHIEECVAFAQKNGMMSDQQLQDSQKVLAAIKSGLKPPACGGPKQCNAYCSSPEHMEECMTFSLAAGVVPDDQKEQMQKTLAAIKQGAKPPACQPNQPGQSGSADQSGQGLQSCDKYCGTHMEECMTFSLAAGMIPDNQKEQAQKTLDALKQGVKPPACQPNRSGQPGQSDQQNQSGQNNQTDQSGQDLQACDQYCADPAHIEECVKFSVAVGNMTEQQAQTAIKTGGKGPGGCIGRDACDAFCNNPDNQEKCFQFGKDNGMIPQEDLQKMQDGQQRMKDSFSSIPPEVLNCISSSLGADVVEKMKTGSVIQRKDGDSINQCFQKFGVQERRPGQNQNDQGQQNQQGQPGQSNQQIQPWADMCKPDGNGNPTELACVDETGKFVASAAVGSDGKPVCPAGSAAECGNYQQQNQQGQPNQPLRAGQSGGPNGGQGFNPGSGQNDNGQGRRQGNESGQPNQPGQQRPLQPGPGAINPGNQQMPQQAGPGGCKGPEECQKYCASNPEVCKNFQPQQNQGQSGQPGGAGGPNQGQGFNSGSGQGGNGPGFGQPNQPGQFIQGQPGQIQPQQQQQFQSPPPPSMQQQNSFPPPSSLLNGVQKFLANIFDVFK